MPVENKPNKRPNKPNKGNKRPIASGELKKFTYDQTPGSGGKKSTCMRTWTKFILNSVTYFRIATRLKNSM